MERSDCNCPLLKRNSRLRIQDIFYYWFRPKTFQLSLSAVLLMPQQLFPSLWVLIKTLWVVLWFADISTNRPHPLTGGRWMGHQKFGGVIHLHFWAGMMPEHPSWNLIVFSHGESSRVAQKFDWAEHMFWSSGAGSEQIHFHFHHSSLHLLSFLCKKSFILRLSSVIICCHV